MSYQYYQEYKDSGLGWLDEIPSHWGVVQSRRLFYQRKERAKEGDEQLTASQKYGMIFQKEFMEREGQKVVQVLTGSDILKHVEPNDFVISMRSFQGGLEHCKYSGSMSSAYIALVPVKCVVPEYFTYLFKCYPYIQALQSTSNLVRDGQALRFENFSLVHLPIVPEEEQKQIADFLDRKTTKIDTLIERGERLISLLQEKRQAMISHAVTKGLNPNAPMKDSGIEWLGEIPEHWEFAPLKRFAYSVNGYAFNSDDFVDDGVPLIRIGDFDKIGNIHLETARHLPINYITQHKDYLLSDGDILIAMTGGTVGKAGKYNSDKPALLNQRVCCLKNLKTLTINYLWYLLNSPEYKEHVNLHAFGGAQPNISDTELLSFWTCLPPAPEQEQIADFLDHETTKIDALIDKSQQQIEKHKEHRSALISATVTGKIDVRDWDKKEKAA